MERFVKKILRKRRFWLLLIAFLLVSIFFDFIFGTVVVVKSISIGKWNVLLLLLGLLYVLTSFYGYKVAKSKEAKNISKILWLVCLLFSWKMYGFITALYFNFIVTFTARVFRLIMPALIGFGKWPLFAS